MPRFRSKPTEVEAIQWLGDNFDEITEFGAPIREITKIQLELFCGKNGAQQWVPVPVGHWIVRMPDDLTDHWPVDGDYFEQKYESLE